MFLVAVFDEERFWPLVFFVNEEMSIPISMCLVQGVFVIDSSGCVYRPEKWYINMANLLFEVHRITKQKCLALVSSAAHFSDGSYSGMLDVLRASMAPPSWIMWLSMVNAIHIPGADLHSEMSCIDDLLLKCYQCVPMSCLVYVGSAKLC